MSKAPTRRRSTVTRKMTLRGFRNFFFSRPAGGFLFVQAAVLRYVLLLYGAAASPWSAWGKSDMMTQRTRNWGCRALLFLRAAYILFRTSESIS